MSSDQTQNTISFIPYSQGINNEKSIFLLRNISNTVDSLFRNLDEKKEPN